VRRLRGARGSPYSWSAASFGATAAEDPVDLTPQIGPLAATAGADVERERRLRQARVGRHRDDGPHTAVASTRAADATK
jgi:hypothetical protein